MALPIREWTHWAAGYGLPRASLKLLARRGDPLSHLLTIDANPVSDLYPLIERVRARGRMSPVERVGWVTADAQIVREVLRDSRFRTIKPRDRSPFRFLQWILAKTAPGVPNPLEPPSMLVTDAPEHTRLRKLVSRSFTPRALDPEEVVALHDMRIAAKRLRYILEVTADTCFGPYAKTALKRIKDLQDLLGEIHDCDVQLPRVVEREAELRSADALEARARAREGADDLDPRLARRTAHATAWRGLATLAVYLQARRDLLFGRFLALWIELERDGFRARLEYAARERPASTIRTRDGNGRASRAVVESV